MNLKAKEQIAFYGLHENLSYKQLLVQVADMFESLSRVTPITRPLVLLQLDTSINAVVVYITCLHHNLPVILAAPTADVDDLLLRYEVNLHVVALEQGIECTSICTEQHALNTKIAVLLSTSGSTGSPKLVMLSKQNIESNAKSIVEYLDISSEERALSSLPFYYSYGLSVLNSHLVAGASMVLGPADLLSKQLWQQAKQHRATSFAGVPFSYEMLLKLRLERVLPDSITTLTQAGGKLAEKTINQLSAFAKNNQKRFFVMYGQTEATARMAYIDNQDLEVYPGSIGQAIPGGELMLKPSTPKLTHQQQDNVGELIYRGPNVMLGYAKTLADLCKPDLAEMQQLATGDLAYCLNKRYYIVGRIKRIIKLRGIRFSLDELETGLKQSLEADWLFCSGEDDRLVVIFGKGCNQEQSQAFLRQKGIHPTLVSHYSLAKPLYNQNGKPDLAKMLELASE
ncbi:AMP-binding protein [Agarivorans sp. B2Z047]|uniref:AMP-binding protein n=1 Tax=Agarivorans sp. B2Z047 TaxID=2652721 RepID=UPI00128B6EC8|nr:AMP-binding protein [Agarivorans sp. B2Z047]MPW28667.1 AMP-binding protein [Agarivorans sp. B2Z047]UQN41228.1 AMP-binding protein [Agarivorans sp. B2Z047]